MGLRLFVKIYEWVVLSLGEVEVSSDELKSSCDKPWGLRVYLPLPQNS